MHQDSSHVAAFDVRFAYAEMYGEIVKARGEGTMTLEDVVLTGNRVNAYDTLRLYDRLPISSHSSSFLSMYRTVLSRAQVVKDPRSRVFTRDYFWRSDVCAWWTRM